MRAPMLACPRPCRRVCRSAPSSMRNSDVGERPRSPAAADERQRSAGQPVGQTTDAGSPGRRRIAMGDDRCSCHGVHGHRAHAGRACRIAPSAVGRAGRSSGRHRPGQPVSTARGSAAAVAHQHHGVGLRGGRSPATGARCPSSAVRRDQHDAVVGTARRRSSAVGRRRPRIRTTDSGAAPSMPAMQSGGRPPRPVRRHRACRTHHGHHRRRRVDASGASQARRRSKPLAPACRTRAESRRRVRDRSPHRAPRARHARAWAATEPRPDAHAGRARARR